MTVRAVSHAARGIEQCNLLLLYQSVILSVIDYGLCLTTLSQSNLQELDTGAKRSHESLSGNNKRHIHGGHALSVDLPPVETRH